MSNDDSPVPLPSEPGFVPDTPCRILASRICPGGTHPCLKAVFRERKESIAFLLAGRRSIDIFRLETKAGDLENLRRWNESERCRREIELIKGRGPTLQELNEILLAACPFYSCDSSMNEGDNWQF